MLDQSSTKADVDTKRPLSIALGFERFGLIAMRTPILSMIVLALCRVAPPSASTASRSMTA